MATGIELAGRLQVRRIPASVQSGEISKLKITRLLRYSPVPIPLSFSYWQGNGGKGMKNSEASGCITAKYCIAMPMARFSANTEVAFERYIEDVSVRRFEGREPQNIEHRMSNDEGKRADGNYVLADRMPTRQRLIGKYLTFVIHHSLFIIRYSLLPSRRD